MFAEAKKKMTQLCRNEKVYVYSTDSDSHAIKKSKSRSKSFRKKENIRDKDKDICDKILYEEDAEEEPCTSDLESSSICNFISHISLFHFTVFIIFCFYKYFLF